ncbi:hypothetical protein [Cryptosporangium minutisporangium]|uniref:hypothetical protein n=1 Tax=Cryptosporangium minutisporangium TaxID=113569 RepID=UPI0031E7B147
MPALPVISRAVTPSAMIGTARPGTAANVADPDATERGADVTGARRGRIAARAMASTTTSATSAPTPISA